MATKLIVAAPFGSYLRGQIITDQATIDAILAGPYSDQVRSIIPTTSGSAGGNSISGVPSAIQVGVAIAGTYQASASGQFVCVRLAGTDVLPRVALLALSGALPIISSPSIGTGTVAMYSAANGGSPLFETGPIVFTAVAPNGVVLSPNAVFITDSTGAPALLTLGSGLSIVNGTLVIAGSGGTTPTPNTLTDSTGDTLVDSSGQTLVAA